MAMIHSGQAAKPSLIRSLLTGARELQLREGTRHSDELKKERGRENEWTFIR